MYIETSPQHNNMAKHQALNTALPIAKYYIYSFKILCIYTFAIE